MKKFAMTAAIAAAALCGLPAVAHAEWYAGAAYQQYQLDNADVGGLTGRLGYKFTPNLALEGEATVGVDDDNNAELNNAYGAYGVASLPVGGSGFDVHARAGYQRLDVDGSGPQASIDDGGFSYGAGVGWNVGQRWGLRADWTRTEVDDNVDAISLGAQIGF